MSRHTFICPALVITSCVGRNVIMSRKIVFNDEQVNILAQNSYTHSVSNYRISFTLEFKKFFAEQMNVPGMTTSKIFTLAGYDASWFSRDSKDAFRKEIRKELNSGTGLKPPRGLSQKEKATLFAKKDLSKQSADASIKELQDKVVYLEQQLEFLKKISNLRNQK